MSGLASTCRKRWISDISMRRTSTPAVASVRSAPATFTLRPSSFSSSSDWFGSDEVDHLQLERLVRGDRHRLAHRLDRPLDVALALLRDRFDVGREQVLRLLAGDVLLVLASRRRRPVRSRRPARRCPTGCAAPIDVPGAIAATWPAIVMKVPADPAQAPCGATYTITGTLALSIAWMMSLVAETRPPGVSSSRISATAPSSAALRDRALDEVGRRGIDRAGDADRVDVARREGRGRQRSERARARPRSRADAPITNAPRGASRCGRAAARPRRAW